MDLASINAGYQSIKTVKDILHLAFEAKVDSAAKEKINEALHKLGEVQDTLYYLREELFALQSANDQLRKEIDSFNSWQETISKYELVKTLGEATVFKFIGQPEHFICPSCLNAKKEIHILQKNRSNSGNYRCPGCKTDFAVEPMKRTELPSAYGRRGKNDWMGN